jgi:hypothetical protein
MNSMKGEKENQDKIDAADAHWGNELEYSFSSAAV